MSQKSVMWNKEGRGEKGNHFFLLSEATSCSRGQAFTVFKMLLAVVIATALLVIVYGVTRSIEYPYYGFETVRDYLVLKATHAPGECLGPIDVQFRKNEVFPVRNFGENIAVNIQWQPIYNSIFGSTATTYSAAQAVKAPSVARCTLNPGGDFSCTVWLGLGACP